MAIRPVLASLRKNLGVTVTAEDVLDELRASALSEADKGSKFERLVKAFLTTDPVYAEQFSRVWLWSEWPGNGGKHDTGIDLVAEDRNTGDLVAIQAKCYAPTSSIGKPDIDSFMSASGKEGFKERIIVSTTDRWNQHAEEAVKGQQIPVRRIGMADFVWSTVDWAQFSLTTPEVMHLSGKKTPRPHQRVAIDKVKTGFEESDRGKLIMACGTGKTFTSLRLAEETVGPGGSVLFLVPSISLLSQTVREWVGNAEVKLRVQAVCSDPKSTRRSAKVPEDISSVDLALPATTNVDLVIERLGAAEADAEAMTVVFSTYQSIDVVARAQRERGGEFDLIVCDEAHRTTGTTLADEDESAFVRVHDNNYLAGARRLYMTATPRIYGDQAKTKAGQADAVVASMDNEELYGPEFHRLGFGEAVEQGLLTDYKVLVLAVDEEAVARTFQQQLSDANSELELDDAAKIVGCWNGLAKRGLTEHSFEPDSAPMRRAVAFAGTIKASKKIDALFAEISSHYVEAAGLDDRGKSPLECRIQHVDGTFNALERNGRIEWLQRDPGEGACRILTNARCLSEGVDVPALDAVMFLAPRKSPVDIVQSVGRVMRKSPGKQFGYIILPIGIPSGVPAAQALNDNKRYAAVWEVLQALRAHDERFNAMVNRISLTSKRDEKINVIGVGGGGGDRDNENTEAVQGQLALVWHDLDELRDALYSKIVDKVGTRRYWTEWAKDVADIAQRQITRINALLSDSELPVANEFKAFLDGLRGNLNDSISQTDAVEMLAQHLITRPIFNALFEGYDFLGQNPVAQTMERMLNALDKHNLEAENDTLEKFYDSVRMRVQGIDSAEGRQRIIIELYDTFFRTAFAKTVDKLGIVYTPVEIVDFILNSADHVLRAEFGQGLTDEGVHTLDGFTGTGTFMVRLIQSGLIKQEDLARKYANELHANEILLLAYYIAAVNIETAYQDAMKAAGQDVGYEEFPGLILTDTFQSWEDDDRLDYAVFRENNARLEHLKALPIRVIVGNPPYSVGQDSANDENKNEAYPALDASIRSAYVAPSSAGLSRNMYDSYIRAIRWASLRVADRGVIAYVTNGGWLISASADGLRKSLADEFSAIYVFNLRGNQRTAGEQSRREGGKVFGGGSRATVAITVLVKDESKPGPATIHYADIGDYLSREQKLAKLAASGSIGGVEFKRIEPNEHGDWLNQRRDDFGTFLALRSEAGSPSIFSTSTLGVSTSRDAWVYNFSSKRVRESAEKLISTYEAIRVGGPMTSDPSRISWSSGLRSNLERGRPIVFNQDDVVVSAHRPFTRQWLYAGPGVIERPGKNLAFRGVSDVSLTVLMPIDRTPFSVMALADIPNLNYYVDALVAFPRLVPGSLVEDGTFDFGAPTQNHNITDWALGRFQAAYGERFTKDDVFFYVYGLLHSPEYRQTYAADLKKMLPRVPLVEDAASYVAAGRALAELHLSYESIEPYPLRGLDAAPTGDPYDFLRVEKMAFAKVREDGKLVPDKSTIKYNSKITVSGIPEDAYGYMLGSRSAVEWILDRYQIKADKASGIVNDPNDWSREVGNPRYILDLLARVVTVSVETMKIVDALPALAMRQG